MGMMSVSAVAATWLTAPNANENTARYETAFTKSMTPASEMLMRLPAASSSCRAIKGTADTMIMVSANASSMIPLAQKMMVAAIPPIR